MDGVRVALFQVIIPCALTFIFRQGVGESLGMKLGRGGLACAWRGTNPHRETISKQSPLQCYTTSQPLY